VVVDKASGALVAQEREGISRGFSTASGPRPRWYGQRATVGLLGGGDGWCYAFAALPEAGRVQRQGSGFQGGGTDSAGGKAPAATKLAAAAPAASEIASLRCVWRFDCDPTGPKENIHKVHPQPPRESQQHQEHAGVPRRPAVTSRSGGDIWWGKLQAWLQCIDATKTGDITSGGLLWSYPVERHCCSTPAVRDGLAYVADCAGKVHCVDAPDRSFVLGPRCRQ